ncbi:Glu-tRNA(Gln) amidotransferase GatDE subunit D [Candidatus Woesearchaeota archaeon CG_4_10_14_0_2_um_filter_33_13]|nr:MAG: Glu-tRNA(Gln) amidotransferase GatDE subunit D [Candidatus Woesearchaeota archaeon CG_4_10_14_0_2_um_filter_33_13]
MFRNYSPTMVKVGDKIKVLTESGEEQGIMMPSPDLDVVIIKLSNGYNIGFDKKNIKKTTLIEELKPISKEKKEIVSPKDGLKTISILHCGGTIASKVDYQTGAVKAQFSPEELLEMFPELSTIVNLRSKLISNMLSENMVFAHYNLIAKEIEKEIKAGSQGIILTHGTDTLHYTAAALSFILEGLNVPVLLVGAQRSSDRGSSDAFMNLRCAAHFIAQTNFAEVAICMHASAGDEQCAIISGTRARKLHSSRRDAFKSINSDPFAFIDNNGKVEWQRKDFAVTAKRDLKLKLMHEKIRVGILRSHPQMYHEEIEFYEKFDGLILEGTGLGHFPVEKYDPFTGENEVIYHALGKLAKKMPVVMTLQTIFGGVNMNVYTPGRMLQSVGILGNGFDITVETAFIKLAWLLSNYERKDIKDLWSKNFRGEFSKTVGYQPNFLK